MSGFRQQKLEKFVAWVAQNVTGYEKGEAQIFLDRLFQAFGQQGALDVGGKPEFRLRKAKDDGGGIAFADYVWKPIVLVEIKKRGTDLSKHYRQAFDYWVRLVPNRPRYVILCNFDEFWIYDFEIQMDTPMDQVEIADLPLGHGPLAFLFPTKERPARTIAGAKFGNYQSNRVRQECDSPWHSSNLSRSCTPCYKRLCKRGPTRVSHKNTWIGDHYDERVSGRLGRIESRIGADISLDLLIPARV